MEENQSQLPETPESTEESEERVSKEKLDGVVAELESRSQTTEGELDELEEKLTKLDPEAFGPLAPSDSDMGVALQFEGITPSLLARKLKILLESVEPKWNPRYKKWDYFIPSELWRRCIEMIMKVRGDYAPEKRVNIHTDANLEEILLSSKGMTPEEARKKIIDYIDVEVIEE